MNRFLDFHNGELNHVPMPPLEECRSRFKYDPATGKVFNQLTGKEMLLPRKRKSWNVLWLHGYNYPAARMVWYIATGEDPGQRVIFFKDRDSSNLCFKNLELLDVSEASRRGQTQARINRNRRAVA